MTADEFILWAESQNEGRYELVAGEVVSMAPERSRHALVKARVWRALDDAVRTAQLACSTYPDGMTVVIDERTVYEPDALVRCGEPLDDDAVRIIDPVIIVEVLSPSSRARDAGAKLADYVRLPSLRHYLLIDAKTCAVVHHRIEGGGRIETRVLRDGSLDLDPPGLTIAIADLFSR
jgi:Uma2 family endonuclease